MKNMIKVLSLCVVMVVCFSVNSFGKSKPNDFKSNKIQSNQTKDVAVKSITAVQMPDGKKAFYHWKKGSGEKIILEGIKFENGKFILCSSIKRRGACEDALVDIAIAAAICLTAPGSPACILWKSFSFSSTFRLESARPYTITTGRDDNGDSLINDRPIGLTRNSERGEWFKQVDAYLTWRKKIGKEDAKNPLSGLKNQIMLSVNVQNLLNQTNKQNFIGIQNSPFFRQATSSAPARTIQFGLSYIF